MLPMTQAQAAGGFDFGGGGGNLGGELLENTSAFAISAEAVDANMVRLTWRIADGYYMYRDKFQFKSANSDFSVGKAAFPKGKIKKDLIFGKVETYRTTLSADLPVTANGSTDTLKLSVTTQGCADIGVCYPPLTQILDIKMPVASAATTATSGALSQISTLGNLLGPGSNDAEFLPPDEAFRLDAGVIDAMTLRASWSIADGYYLYKDKFKFRLIGDDGIQLASIDLPAGKVKIDPNIGKTEIFLRNLSVELPLKRTHGNAAKVKLVVTYQGCADAGLCYPPQTRTIPFELAGTNTLINTAAASTQPAQAETSDKTSSIQSLISNLIFAFGIGVLLTFTPCVLPMIPILGSMVVGQGGKKPSKTRSGLLSFSYVMGTGVTYSAAGWLAGYSGGQLQAYTQNVWGIGIVVAILVMLSLSMFGFYQIQMPAAIQSRMQRGSTKLKGGSFTGVFFMGIISALIVGACVTPLLMLVLGIAIKAGDPALGAAMMFSLAMGMGVFLVIIGVGAGHLLPKAGIWMQTIKQFFGALLIGVAIYLLTPLADVPVLLLWSVFLIIVAVYMGATQALPEGSNKWRYLWKGIGIVLLLWGVLAMLGGIVGNRDITQPIGIKQIGLGSSGGGSGGTGKVVAREVFIRLENTRQLDEQLAQAKISGKAVLLDYYAEWCTDCRRMEKATFDDPRVQQIMNDRFVALQVDVTDPNNDDTEAIKKRYGVFGPPAMLFFDKSGKRMENINFYGFKGPDDFIALLNKI